MVGRLRMRRADRSLLIGLDVGSTAVKAALVRFDGSIEHVARRPTPYRSLAGGSGAHDPDALLGAAEAVVAECAAAAAQRPVAGLGIASMAEAGVPLGRGGRPLGEIIPWFDPRSASDAEALAREVGPEALFAATGLRAEAKSTLAKLRWLGRHRPATIRRATAWAGVAELVGLAFGGGLATNASLACRTLAFDVRAGAWDAGLLGLAGFDPERMPRVVPLGWPVGGLLAPVARRLGLRAGLPVAIAGHDHLVGALGAGVARPGQALDSLGSAEACLLVTAEPLLRDELRREGFSVGRHPLDGRSYVLGGLQASGALVEWFVDAFLPGPAAPDERYARFLATVGAARSTPTGLVVLPYLRGRTAPAPDREARLVVAGLGPADGLPDVALALLEGTAFAARWLLEALERTAGTRLGTVRLIGGGTRNPAWLRTKTAVSTWPSELVEADEAVCLGAALVGGIAGGVFASPAAALRSAAPIRRLPRDRAAAGRYEEVYRRRFLPAVAAATTG